MYIQKYGALLLASVGYAAYSKDGYYRYTSGRGRGGKTSRIHYANANANANHPFN